MTASLPLRAETLRQQRSVYTDLFCLPYFNIGEPAKEFLEAAHQAGFRANGDTPESKKEFFEKIGSNRVLKNRKLNFSYELPWSILVGRDKNLEWWS